MSADVSVVIPCYNAEASIQRALLSVAAQSLQPREVVCVNDGSTDTTQERLYVLQSQLPSLDIRIITSGDQRGPARARNTGWDAACAEYIAFLDADDTWHPQKLSLQHEFMRNHPEIPFSGHAVGVRAEKEVSVRPKRRESIRLAHFKIVTFKHLLISNRFLTPSVIIRRDVCDRFDESLRRCEDYELWVRLSAKGNLGWRSSTTLAFVHKFYYGAGGLSGDIWKMGIAQRQMFRDFYQKQMLSSVLYGAVISLSWLKLIRRLAINKLNGSR
jgi:glycosyltransferase involved in cell wall biosynthesis